MKEKRGTEGYTLIELMIACAIFCVIMIGFLSFLYQQSGQGMSQAERQTHVQLQNGIQTALRSSDTISATENAAATPLPVDQSSSVFQSDNTAEDDP